MPSFSSPRLKAFSLIEAAIVLAIIGLVLGGLWVAASEVRTRIRVNKLADDITQTVKNIESNKDRFFGATVTTDTMAQMGLLPKEYVYKSASTYVDTSTGYNMYATWSDVGGVNIMVGIPGGFIPSKVCISLAMRLAPLLEKSRSTNSNIAVIQTSPSYNTYFYFATSLPTPAALATRCTAGVGYLQYQWAD